MTGGQKQEQIELLCPLTLLAPSDRTVPTGQLERSQKPREGLRLENFSAGMRVLVTKS